ncbi:MAG: hypothetical protein ABUK01_11785 [Leptospirales bacterium]
MPLIGQNPDTFTLDKWGLPGQNVIFTPLGFGNKITLLSFINIEEPDPTLGWNWITNLSNIATALGANAQVIAVIFKTSGGTVTDGEINTRRTLNSVTISGGLTLLKDVDWAISAANNYQVGGFSADPSFTKPVSNGIWSYIVSEDFQITDKWHLNTTDQVDFNLSDPVSFNRFQSGGSQFNSVDFTISESFAIDRLNNLFNPPYILGALPVEANPVNSLPSVDIVFSKPIGVSGSVPIDVAPIVNMGNYGLSGAGAAGAPLNITGVNYGLIGQIENVVIITTNDNLSTGPVVITPTVSITDLNGVVISTPKTNVTYNADVTPPSLTSINIYSSTGQPLTHAKENDTVTINFTADDNLAVTPAVTIGNPPVAASVTGGATTWVATHDMTAGQSEGIVVFQITNIQDTLGNSSGPYGASIPGGNTVTYDRTLPQIGSVTGLATDNTWIDILFTENVYGAAGAGTVANNKLITGNFTITNSNAGNPVGNLVVTHIPGDNTARVNFTTFSDADAGEIITITIIGVFDTAGNESAVGHNIDSPLNDIKAPVLDPISIASNNPIDSSIAGPTHDVTVSFTASEPVTVGSATLNTAAATVTDTGSNNWTATKNFTSGDTEGLVIFEIINVSDGTNNVPLTNSVIGPSQVTFDKTAPVFAAPATAIFPLVNNTQVEIAFDEIVNGTNTSLSSLVGNAVVTVTPSNSALLPVTGVTFTHVVNTDLLTVNFTLAALAQAGDTITIEVDTVYDKAGNLASNVTSGAIALIDETSAQVVTAEIRSNNYGNANNNQTFAKPGDTVTVAFTTSEPLSAPPLSVTIANSGPLTPIEIGGPTSWEATYVMPGANAVANDYIFFNITGINDGTNPPVPDVIAPLGSNVDLVWFWNPQPAINTPLLEADNSFITLTFNRDVYANTGATGSLDNTDLDLTFTQGGGTATSVTKGTVTHNPLTKHVVKLNLTTTGTANGLETIEINPVLSQIFDAAGNPALATDTTGVLLLSDVTPDVFVRDNIDDDGVEPSTGGLSLSPDIISLASNPSLATLQADYGGSDPLIVKNYNLGSTPEFGQDNYILVRAQNRGAVDAVNVVATVYWAQFSTSILPVDWHLIGDAVFPANIPNDGDLYVSNPLTWLSADIPVVGHYCLIAVIGCDGDPKPSGTEITAAVTNSTTYMQYIRDVNDITYRNMNVIDDIPAPPPPAPAPAPGSDAPAPPPEPAGTPDGKDPYGFLPLPFVFAGMANPNTRTPMQLEMHLNLPKGSRAFLEVPLNLVEPEKVEYTRQRIMVYAEKQYEIIRDQNIKPKFNIIKIDRKRKVAWIFLNPHQVNSFDNLAVAAEVKYNLRLFLQIPKEFINNRYKAYAVQLVGGEELGRAAWFLGRGWRPPKKPGIVYRFFRKVIDFIFMQKKRPRYLIKY